MREHAGRVRVVGHVKAPSDHQHEKILLNASEVGAALHLAAATMLERRGEISLLTGDTLARAIKRGLSHPGALPANHHKPSDS